MGRDETNPVTLAPGDLYGRTVLGSSAIYRVVANEGELVVVEVVRAPSLAPGVRMRFSRSAVTAMERIERQRSGVEDVLRRWAGAA
jgi:hypothetical protein